MMKKWKTGVAALVVLVGVTAVVGQGGDSATHRGQNSRVGVNPDPAEIGPGFAALQWWHPTLIDAGKEEIVDNFVGAPDFTTTGTWTIPTPLDESPDWFAPTSTPGAGLEPYLYAFTVASTVGTGDPTAGETATATWIIDDLDATKFYSVWVWFPSSGTRSGGGLIANSDFAVYKIEHGSGREFVDVLPHLGGGFWTRLGRNLGTEERIFQPDAATGEIIITLYNTVPRDEFDVLMGPVGNTIVAADAVLAIEGPGEIFASPVVKEIGPAATDIIAVSVRNEARPDPTDPLGSRQITTGTVYALEAFQANPNVGLPRWVWSPSLVTSVNLVFDNTNPAFSADAGWTQPAVPAAPGFFGTDYADSPVDLVYPGSARAVWDPDLPQDGFYDIYVWFPGSGGGKAYARAARYVVDENGATLEIGVDQDVGGQWVRLGTRSFLHDEAAGGLEVEVWNHSFDPLDAGRFVAADAIMFVGSATGAIFSTPTIANVSIKKDNGLTEPTEVVFVAAEDGRIYCLDARGGGGNTTLYWAYPSIPDINDPGWTDPNDPIDGPAGNRVPMPGSFGVSSMLVENIGGRDLLFIAAQNGRVYAIETVGRGDYDPSTLTPGTTTRVWTWPDAVYDNATGTQTVEPDRPPFVGSVAYDDVTGQIFAAGTEGRLFALDAAGNGDQTTDMNWAFPTLTDPVIGALSSTPAIGGGRVIFPSFDGRVYAREVNGGTALADNWQYPPAVDPPLLPFDFTSVCYVPAALLAPPVVPDDLVYFVNDDGTVYCVQGSDGVLVWSENELGIGAFSSPYFTPLQPPGTLTVVPTITFGTKDGAFVALYAHPLQTNVAGGRLAWGWQSIGDFVFASPAISRQWMYHAGVDGILYAFSSIGTAFGGGGGAPGRQIVTPNNPIPGFENLAFKFVSRADYSNLRQSPAVGDPRTMTELFPPPAVPALEWGERLNVVAYNFVYPANPADVPTIRFRITGGGGINIRMDRVAQLVDGETAGDPNSGFAVAGIPMNGTGRNFLTPGSNIQVDVHVIVSGQQYNTPEAPRQITVANPLTVATVPSFGGIAPPLGKSIGWNTNPSDPENLINGSNNKAIMSSTGQVVHGQSGATSFLIADRSRMLELIGGGLRRIRMARGDAEWQGGVAAVVKELPYVPAWEELPAFIPNLSRDYPDIDRTEVDLVADPFGVATDPLLRQVRLRPPTNFDPNDPLTRIIEPVPFGLEFSVLRFQPANLTRFIDAAGESLEGGYRARAVVFVDSNSNGRPDGLEQALSDLPPQSRREAFRSLNLGASVPVDESLAVVEPTVDLGAEPHSLGYTTAPPWDPANVFVPDISAGAPYRQFFQPFTVRNEGNVNMLDLRVATRIGQFPGPVYYSVAFGSDANDPLSWIDGSINIFSNLNPPYAPFNGAVNASGDPRVTLHKARPGDRAATVLSVPDVPYGFPAPPNSLPLVGVSVPLGFPVGDYSQLINVVEDNFLVGGLNDTALMLGVGGLPLEAYSDPTMTVKFINRETRLTGGATFGVLPHVDDPLGAASNFTWTNTAPAAYRDETGSLHLAWQSNRPGLVNGPGVPLAQDVWSLFHGVLRGLPPSETPAQAGASPFRDLMAWTSPATKFWLPFAGPEPGDPPNALFAGTPGVVVGAPQFEGPAFPVNVRAGPVVANVSQNIFWAGRALKDSSNPPDGTPDFRDNRIFYAPYEMASGAVVPQIREPRWLINDPEIEKNRLRPLHFGSVGLAVFWYGEVNGQSKMFQNVRTVLSPAAGDQTANWTQNLLIDPGRGFAAAFDPTPIERPGGVDLVFTGRMRDRTQSELFYAKFRANSQGRLLDLRSLSERNREVLAREGMTNTYRARGVNWNTRRSFEVWMQRPGQAAVRLDIASSRSRDSRSGVISFDSETGGKIYLDPHTGTVRFSTGGPGSGAQVQLRYTPRVVRVTGLGNTGGHSNPSSFLDNREEWNRDFWSRAGNYSPIIPLDRPRVGRLWHVYERGATGPGQMKRPYMQTQRLGVQLNFPVAIDPATGQPLVSVGGMAGTFYQVDPGNGRIYFTVADEAVAVTVTYQYRDAVGNLFTDVVAAQVSWIRETAEQPVPIERAVDESSVYAFPDPFYDQYEALDPRPGMVWMFFTSTRAGSRDVYYLTLAPRLGPFRFMP